MSVIVCGQNFWPIPKQDRSCTLPAVLLQGSESFQKYYDSVHSGRLLTFHPELGSVEVKARFKNKSHEITLSTHGMVVLALFEGMGEEESLSYTVRLSILSFDSGADDIDSQDISATTSIGSSELRRTLQSLACAKYKILTKKPKGRDIDDSDTFTYNYSFSCPLAKIKIQTVANKVESAEEKKETDSRVDEARNQLCDVRLLLIIQHRTPTNEKLDEQACIVRVMKDRRTLNHQDLVNEVVKQLAPRFQPRPAMIKIAIERSIEKEYIERDSSDRKVLRYLVSLPPFVARVQTDGSIMHRLDRGCWGIAFSVFVAVPCNLHFLIFQTLEVALLADDRWSELVLIQCRNDAGSGEGNRVKSRVEVSGLLKLRNRAGEGGELSLESFVEHILCFVDLGGEVGASSTIWMISGKRRNEVDFRS